MEQKNARHGMLLMLLCTLFWSLSGLLIRMLPWHGLVIAGGRSAFASIIVALYMKWHHIPLRLTRKSLLGAVSLASVFVIFILANKLTASANAIVLQQCAPAVVLLYNILSKKARARLLDVATVAITLIGITLFFFDQFSPGSLAGNLLGLLSGVFLAVNFLVQGESSAEESMSGILLAHLITIAVGLPFALVYDTPLTSTTLSVIALMGVVQLGIPYVLYGLATRSCPPLAISLIGMGEAVFNPIWVAIAYGEVPGTLPLLGGALVLSATIFWAVKSSKKS